MLARVAGTWVGTSGWRYPPWRRTFYPAGLAQRRELEHLSRRVSSIEINGSFYSLQRPESYRAWAAETPDGFVFAVKGGRFITHLKQLRDVRAPLANFFASGVLALGPKLGPAAVAAAAAAALRPRARRGVPHHAPARHRGRRRAGRRARRAPRRARAHRDRRRPAAAARPGGAAPELTPTRRSSSCSARTTWPSSSPTRRAPGRTWRTSPPTSSTSGCTVTASSTPAGTRPTRSTRGRRRSARGGRGSRRRGSAPSPRPRHRARTAVTCSSTSTTTPRCTPRTTRSAGGAAGRRLTPSARVRLERAGRRIRAPRSASSGLVAVQRAG